MKRFSSNNNLRMGPRFGVFMTLLCGFLLPSTTNGQSCIDDFQDIYTRESFVTDTSIPRLYIVCPRHIYDIGNIDFDGNIIQPAVGRVAPPLPLRPNMTIRCGDQGTRDNLCWLRAGDLHVDGTKVLGIADETVENVRIEGFVFIGAREHALLVNKPGDITFRDCEFREFKNSSVPIMLDYYDASNPSEELVATFVDCDFVSNRYFGMGSQSALIYGNGVQNRIVIENTLFQNNDMVWNNTRPDTHSYLVESLGPVTMSKTCFKDNLVGASAVVVFGNTFTHEQNYISNSSGVMCPFSSVFETIAQFESFVPTCVENTWTACDRFVTPSPTGSPSASPTAPVPSASPTGKPTISPKPTITPKPTGKPTMVAPTQSPVELDFFWPSMVTEAPSPSAAPVYSKATAMLLLLWGTGLYCFFL